MAFGITDLKKGAIFKLDGTPYRVLEYGQKVMGRGGSIVNVRIKSLIDGKVLEKTFKGNETIEPADVGPDSAPPFPPAELFVSVEFRILTSDPLPAPMATPPPAEPLMAEFPEIVELRISK